MRLALCCLLLLASLPILGCEARYPRLSDETLTLPSGDGRFCMVQYGWNPAGELAYVVFQQAPKGPWRGIVTGSTTETWLRPPGGTPIRLPTSIQLYEVIDGTFRESQERVTRKDFEAFLASHPRDYTIDELLLFVKAQPKSKRTSLEP